MQFGTSIATSAPPAAVWSVYTDVARWPDWTASVTSVHPLDPGPLALGHRVRIKQPRLPAAVWVVTDLADGESWTWTAPGLRTTATHHVGAAADGSGGSLVRLSLRQEGPLGAVLGRLTAGLTDRYLALEAEGLRARSEAR
ncbi:SRPBCC family protein [Actinokineospora sp. PR83]|uniref:SRPBCC family protein n=1 Tax=Actinokineospora sp. PR83 TaxID=2884908 RepID=UPI001F1CC297|nr:SRPBCC family protein [Actinokineospora sp. PR83]MCG8919905.1 SRPBCC family protein [Actinokineospora sp. PR83]